MNKTRFFTIQLMFFFGIFANILIGQDLCPPRFLETDFSNETVDLYWEAPDTADYGDVLLFECFENCNLSSSYFNINHNNSVGGSGGWFRFSDGDPVTCGDGMIPCIDGIEEGFSAVAVWCSTGTTIDSRMYTDLIDLTDYSTAHIQFTETYVWPEFANDSNMVEISNDGGETWETVHVSDPLQVMEDYWYNTVDISAYAGQEIHIAFRYFDATGNGEGWFVDDVRVWGGNGAEINACGNFNEYEIYVDGNAVGVTTEEYYSVEGLTNGTEYCFEVRARYSDYLSDPCVQKCATPMGAFVIDPQEINFDQTLMAGEYHEQTFQLINFDTTDFNYSFLGQSVSSMEANQDLLADDFNNGMIHFQDTSLINRWRIGDAISASSEWLPFEPASDGGTFAYVNDDAIGNGNGITNATMISNEVDITGAETIFLLFDLFYPQPRGGCTGLGNYQQFAEDASISYSTDSGASWEVINSSFTTGFYWTSFMYNLTPHLSGDTSLKIKFNYNDCGGNWAFGIGVNNVAIKQGDMLSWLTISPYNGKVVASDTVDITVGIYAPYDGFNSFEEVYIYGGPYIINLPVGVGVSLALDDKEKNYPDTYRLYNNYPNPFNPETKIDFSLSDRTDVSILIYNILGQKVATLLNNQMDQGNYTIKWKGVTDSGQELPSGTYFCEMKTPMYKEIKKLVLVR